MSPAALRRSPARAGRWLGASALAACVLASCGQVDPSHSSVDAPEELRQGEALAEEWIAAARAGDPLPDSRVIAVGYLERGRLGLGSPFRLAEFALADPRIAEEDRAPTAAALILMAASRQLYIVDPRVMDGAHPLGPPAATVGDGHVGLITRTVREAEEPRAGELAVRIAYSLAGAEGLVRRSAVRNALRVAALTRDRELARRDALALIERAAAEDLSPTGLLARWRADGGANVETPLSRGLDATTEEEGLRLARLATDAVRTLATAEHRQAAEAQRRPPRPLMGLRTAARLAALAARDSAPPRPAVAVALEAHRPILESPVAFGPRGRAAAARFLDRAYTEEALAAEAVLLNARTAPHPVGNSVALWAAVALRPFAQERPWFPGSAAPSAGDLRDRHGIAEVTFDGSVPERWRPVYLAILDGAVRDLRRVMPTLQLSGLRVHVGADREGPGPLALHDPGERRLFLPPATAAGTLAHEIAHDLDWQVALRRYRVRGDYGTDRAFRSASDPLSTRVRGLAAGAPGAGDGSIFDSHWTRPAEVFARGVDWFTVVALGHEGLMNGYLSSVQDDVLTGYGTVPTPDPSGAAGAALIGVLDDVAPAYPATREWFLSKYGPARTFTALDLMRFVLAEANPAAGTEDDGGLPVGPRRLGEALRGYRAAADALESWLCRSPGGAYGAVRADARVELIAEATRSVVRGLAMERAEAVAGQAGQRWLARRLYGGRWREEPVPEIARPELEALVAEVRNVESAVPALEPDGRLRLRPAPDRCGTSAALF